MFSYWAYILIGENNTGKTTFQRYLLYHLSGRNYKRKITNKCENIIRTQVPKGFETIFVSNRSYQELAGRYLSVKNYFDSYFEDASVCILSSHADQSCRTDIQEMIKQLKVRCYNVGAVFFSNTFDANAKSMTDLAWDELLWIENPTRRSKRAIDQQLNRIALNFSDLLIERAKSC